MELINSQYVRLDELDIFTGLLKASENGNDNMYNFFYNLKGLKGEYQKNNYYMEEIFIHIDDLKAYEKLNLKISRQSLLNACFFALINNDISRALQLRELFSKSKIEITELGDLKDYVLEHTLNISEYYNGEKERIIYNSQKNELEKGYIFHQEEKTKKLIYNSNEE